MRIKMRVGIWLIILALGVPLSVACFAGEWQIAIGMAAILGTLASKLVESEEKGG